MQTFAMGFNTKGWQLRKISSTWIANNVAVLSASPKRKQVDISSVLENHKQMTTNLALMMIALTTQKNTQWHFKKSAHPGKSRKYRKILEIPENPGNSGKFRKIPEIPENRKFRKIPEIPEKTGNSGKSRKFRKIPENSGNSGKPEIPENSGNSGKNRKFRNRVLKPFCD
jgi:hypothetical protein